jgi:uncharacterized protein (UPF0216 family)
MSKRAPRNVRSSPTPHCQAKSARSGKPCTARPIRGTKYCNMHTENRASLLGKLGGHPRLQFDVSKLKRFAPPNDAGEMRHLLAVMIIEMREGKIDVELATKVSYVASVFLKSAEQEDMKFVKAELEELKKRFSTQPVRDRR